MASPGDGGGKEGFIMKFGILAIIATTGVLIPLLWMTGTIASIIYFCLHRGETEEEE